MGGWGSGWRWGSESGSGFVGAAAAGEERSGAAALVGAGADG